MLQYDVQLIHQIEGLMGHQLEVFDMKEADVLKGISRVFKAHRKAAMQAAEHEQAEQQRGSAGRKSNLRACLHSCTGQRLMCVRTV